MARAVKQASPKAPRKARRDNYHRGNVREDLLACAEKILEHEGVESVTLRRLTREIGVNPTNFYNHFPHLDDLYAAIKVDGFRELLRREKVAVAKVEGKLDSFRTVARQHLLFAIAHPNLYRLMFDYYHDFDKYPELKQITNETMGYAVFLLYGADIFDARDALKFYKEHPAAVAAWSLLHGLTHILIERQIRLKSRSRKELIAFSDAIIDVLIEGIGAQLRG